MTNNDPTICAKCPWCRTKMERTKYEVGGVNYEGYLCQACNAVFVPFSLDRPPFTVLPSTDDPQAAEAWGSSKGDEERDGDV